MESLMCPNCGKALTKPEEDSTDLIADAWDHDSKDESYKVLEANSYLARTFGYCDSTTGGCGLVAYLN